MLKGKLYAHTILYLEVYGRKSFCLTSLPVRVVCIMYCPKQLMEDHRVEMFLALEILLSHDILLFEKEHEMALHLLAILC